MDTRVKRAIDIIERRLTEKLSEKTLSREVRLSPARLRQLFKKETGLPPMRYVRRFRMKTARNVLQVSLLTVKEVAFQSGFNDVSHFVRDFKKQYGLTPSEFRVGKKATAKGLTPTRSVGE
jgi:AraC-like DNA-binding protein